MDEIAPPEFLPIKRVQKSGIASVSLIDENEQREYQRSDKQLHLADYPKHQDDECKTKQRHDTQSPYRS